MAVGPAATASASAAAAHHGRPHSHHDFGWLGKVERDRSPSDCQIVSHHWPIRMAGGRHGLVDTLKSGCGHWPQAEQVAQARPTWKWESDSV